MRDLEQVFSRLVRSPFRQKFHLGAQKQSYLEDKGLPKVLEHARDFIDKRLAPADPVNDGKQTPFRGHPVFIAQHATGTCCRSCLERNHAIEPGADLTPEQRDYVVDVICRWIERKLQT